MAGQADRFWKELSRTYRAAGSPKLEEMLAWGRECDPPVVSSTSTVNDWLSGKTIPGTASKKFFLIMVTGLEERAKGRAGGEGGSWAKRTWAWWEKLLTAARTERVPQTAAGPVQLPTADALFVGRQEPLGRLLDWLDPAGGDMGVPGSQEGLEPARATASASVLEVTGMGGVGKTGLVVEAARQAVERGWFPGGVLFANLRGHSTGHDAVPEETLDAFLRTLRSREDPPSVPAEKVRRWRKLLDEMAAQQKRLLIILDNVRQAGQLTELFPSLPHRALVTSRHTHTDAIRHRVVLSPFPLAEAEVFVRLRLREPDQDEDPGTAPDGVSMPACGEQVRRIAELCGRLPLALRIVVAVLRTEPDRSLRERVDELERNLLDGMEDDDTDAEGRPLTVRACFSFCYGHLTASRARAFRLLAAAPGQDISTVSAAVLLGVPADAARLALRGLAGMHLLERSRRGREELSEAEREHWSMHDLLRLYADERGRAHADEDNRRDAVVRLLHRYRDVAQAAASIPLITSEEEAMEVLQGHRWAMVWLETERLNVVAAATSAPASAWRVDLALELAEFFETRRYYAEWTRLASSAVDACRSGQDDPYKTIKALHDLARALTGLGRFDEALTALNDADEAARPLNQGLRALIAQQRGVVLAEADRHEEAIGCYETAAGLFQQVGEPSCVADARRHIGDAWIRCNRPDKAEDAYRAALAYYRMAGDGPGLTAALSALGTAQSVLGHHRDALESLETATERSSRTRDVSSHIAGLCNLGSALQRAGQPQAALRHLRNAEELARAFLYHEDQLGSVLVCLGLVLKECGQLQAARSALSEAVDVLREVGDTQRLAVAEQALNPLPRPLHRRRPKRRPSQ
ncbi:NB-ARC domain-containing protein [Streptomyces sp. NPDC102476]|uniref:NB-ARC domain-containing protein n=1 Tax=Streptomyces sp. NPDC102476 TaxID=3366181 RepID=UPI003828DF2D